MQTRTTHQHDLGQATLSIMLAAAHPRSSDPGRPFDEVDLRGGW